MKVVYYYLRFFLMLSNLCLNFFLKVPRKFTSKVEGKMGYEDFVYFILSEEDKSSEPSIEYWWVWCYSQQVDACDLDFMGWVFPSLVFCEISFGEKTKISMLFEMHGVGDKA